MARPKKNGVYDYKEKNGKYSYYVKVVYEKKIDGSSIRRPIRATTIEELSKKVDAIREVSPDGENIVSVTVGEWADRWLDTVIPETVANGTLSFYRSMMRYLPASIRKKKLSAIKPTEIKAFLLELRKHGNKLGKPLSVTTVRSVHSALIMCFNDAIDEGLILVNAAKKVKTLKNNEASEKSFLNKEQCLRLISVAESGEYDDKMMALANDDPGIELLIKQWAILIRLALHSGLRRGEILGLTWSDFNPEARTIYVHKSLFKGKLKPPKTSNSIRTIKIDPDTASKLSEWKKIQQAFAELVGDKFYNPLDLIFTTVGGLPVDVDNFRNRVFNRMIETAGLPKTVTLHSLRHSHATLLLASGTVDAKTISRRLGHSSVAFTLKTYAHVLPEMDDNASDVIGKILSSEKPT